MSAFLLRLTLFFLPLIFWLAPLKFELPKIIFFSIISFFLVLFLLQKYYQQTKKGINLPLFNKTWFLWVGLLLISTILSGKVVPGLFGYGYRHQGGFFFLALGVWLVVFEILTKKQKRSLIWWTGLATLIESLIVLTQGSLLKLGFPILSYNDRPLGTFGEPNAVAGFLVMGLPILTKIYSFPFVFLIVAAVILTGSKAGLGALLAEGLIFSYFKVKSSPEKKFLTILGLFLIIFGGVFGVYKEKHISPFENRWLIWNLGIKAALEKPILGYGAEGIINVYEKQFENINLSLEELVIDRSHNLFLDIVLFSGFLGLAIFIKWLWESARRIKENWQLAGLTGFLVFSFFQPIGVVHWVYLIFLLFSRL